MPVWKLRAYIEQMPKLRAEHTLAQMNIAAFPWMDDRSKRQLIRSLSRDVGANDKPVKATVEDLAALGIPVVRVKTEKKTDSPEG